MSDILPLCNLQSLREAYASGVWTPTSYLAALHGAIEEAEPTFIWISRLSKDQLLEHARRVEARGPASQPLYGVPFAIKDNIDFVDLPTTAACPEFSHRCRESAFVVQRLMDAGAIPLGKTNLDQFATGLVGVRSPYGFPANAFDPDYIPGGSSSGSAIAVARGFAAFALGTDTAGSGRIPAAFNDLVGLKPTRGLISCSGVVPACRTLDCVSIFAGNAADAESVFQVAAVFDPDDAYAREDLQSLAAAPLSGGFRFGVPKPDQLAFFGNTETPGLYEHSLGNLEALGGIPVEIDFGPFLEAARLLYEGPWVAERFAAVEDILTERPEILHPVTRQIIGGGGSPRAVDAFKAHYRLQTLRRVADKIWEEVDVVVTPTAGTIYSIAEVEADPIQLNSNLGYYTNFMNLLDYSAVAVPAGFQASGLPFGITLFAPAFHDRQLLGLARRMESGAVPEFTSDPGQGWTKIVVCGAHMRGLPLNHQLTDRQGRFLEQTRTASVYDFYALPPMAGLPPRPGLIRRAQGGAAIAVEVWALPTAYFGEFVAEIPAPLGIGKVELAEGGSCSGFLCEPWALEHAEDISALADWRKYLAQH